MANNFVILFKLRFGQNFLQLLAFLITDCFQLVGGLCQQVKIGFCIGIDAVISKNNVPFGLRQTPRGRMLGLQAMPPPLYRATVARIAEAAGREPEVADQVSVCSVCGARNDALKRPIHARPDAKVPG